MLSVTPATQEFTVLPGARCCVAEARKVSPAAAFREIARQQDIQAQFTIIHTQLPACRRTAFKVYRTGSELIIAATLGKCDPGEALEIFFDPFHDHVGYLQFVFDVAGGMQLFTHLPYEEARSSAFPLIRVKEYHWASDETVNVVGVPEPGHWLYVRFELDQIFRAGDCCGFNIARCLLPPVNEPTSWNHTTGNLLQDATGFGHLYRTAPKVVTCLEARIEGDRLVCAGEVSAGSKLALTLANPCDDRKEINLTITDGAWSGQLELAMAPAGRYRLYPRVNGERCEPDFFYFDLAPADLKQFTNCMTYDFPDDMRANYYTPERMAYQLDQLAGIGVSRVYWIDYPTYRTYPSFWRSVCDRDFTRESYRHCGDVLTCAAKLSHEKGMEFLGVFKPFDLGGFAIPGEMTDHPVKDGLLRDVDGHLLCIMPEIAAHPGWSWGANPEWAQTASFPITRLRIYSDTPIPPAEAANFSLWVSDDNHAYRPYQGSATITQGEGKFPHYRWTPAGKGREKGTRKQWYLEFAGLNIDTMFLSIKASLDPNCRNQRFLFAEAVGADGREAPVLLTINGSVEKGFAFGYKWSWCNYTEEIVDQFAWRGGALGLAFTERTGIPAMLEPACRPAHRLWLREIERMLRGGVDGIDIRTLCQHYTTESWLAYAFAGPVRQEFRRRFGRDVQATAEDYIRVRQLRGEGYTEFIRQASAMTRKAGKKFAVHLEPGVEVPVEHNIRMQMTVEWQRWLEEGLLDEITLKYWASQSTFVHEQVLPRAKKAGIPVYICDRNFSLNMARAVEYAEALVRDACSAGFAGMNWYETDSYFIMNGEGISMPTEHNDYAIRRAWEMLQRG